MTSVRKHTANFKTKAQLRQELAEAQATISRLRSKIVEMEKRPTITHYICEGGCGRAGCLDWNGGYETIEDIYGKDLIFCNDCYYDGDDVGDDTIDKIYSETYYRLSPPTMSPWCDGNRPNFGGMKDFTCQKEKVVNSAIKIQTIMRGNDARWKYPCWSKCK